MKNWQHKQNVSFKGISEALLHTKNYGDQSIYPVFEMFIYQSLLSPLAFLEHIMWIAPLIESFGKEGRVGR